MSTWSGQSRSNYFHVKNVTAFKDAMERIEISVQERPEDGRVAIFSETEYGSWPSGIWNDDTDDFDDVCVIDEVTPHLIDGEVVVLQQAGAEKRCYVSGFSVAFNSKGDVERVCLDDIYDRAKRLAEEGVEITEAAY